MNARDPVCGVEVDTLRARAVAIVDRRTFYFCCAAHKAEFLADPSRYLAAEGEQAHAQAHERMDEQVDEHEQSSGVEQGEEYDEVPGRRSRPLLFVLLVLTFAAIAGALAILSHRA